jgi:tetratricopeptide (TPR) repeat protein
MVLSLAAALRTLNLAETAGLSPELARGYAAVGALAGFIPLHRTAEAYLNRALVTARKADHLPARAFVSLAVGFYYAGIGNWATAQEHFEQVVEISERLGDRRRQDDGLSNIMYVSHLQGDFWRGAGAADELHARAIRRDEPRIQAVGLQGKANCLLHLGRFGEAMACLEESQALLAEDNEIVDEPLKIELYGLLAIAHLRQSAYSQALSATKQLLAMTTGSFPSNYGTFPGYSSPPEVILTLWQAHYQEPDLDVLAHRACRTLGGFSRVFPIGQPRAQLWQGLYNWLTGHQARAIKAWQESLAAAERMSMLYDQGLAHYEIGRHLERDEPARQMHLARACQLFSEQDAQYNLHLARDETKHSAHE